MVIVQTVTLVNVWETTRAFRHWIDENSQELG